MKNIRISFSLKVVKTGYFQLSTAPFQRRLKMIIARKRNDDIHIFISYVFSRQQEIDAKSIMVSCIFNASHWIRARAGAIKEYKRQNIKQINLSAPWEKYTADTIWEENVNWFPWFQ